MDTTFSTPGAVGVYVLFLYGGVAAESGRHCGRALKQRRCTLARVLVLFFYRHREGAGGTSCVSCVRAPTTNNSSGMSEAQWESMEASQ